ncbi:MAG: hypothetical protein QOJ51_3801 [Acidobacteriaceae bacterium]|nr:hypothetical protein [Acidobacteriaceae bacterium]MEA2260976.1 hypothetical protein [Acidobacteriaceae bacterium]
MRTEPRDFMQLASSNWMEATGDVPEPSRLIIRNSLTEWASRRRALRRESYNRLPTLSLSLIIGVVSRDFAGFPNTFPSEDLVSAGDLTNAGTWGSQVQAFFQSCAEIVRP